MEFCARYIFWWKLLFTKCGKIPLRMTVLVFRVFWLDAACSAAAAVCGGQRGKTKTASSSANERQSSHEASRDVARFRELNVEPTGGSSNYQTNLLWCIQLISYRFSINAFRVCRNLRKFWKFHLSFKSSCYMFAERGRKKVLLVSIINMLFQMTVFPSTSVALFCIAVSLCRG